MRGSAAALVCLPLVAAGCLKQVAPLIGDGGDSGVACDTRDAGLCTDDSQCPDSYYCDYTVTECPLDAGPPDGSSTQISTVNAGSCLPNCTPSAWPSLHGAPCRVAEDCGSAEDCQGPTTPGYCTTAEPCDGECWKVPHAIPIECPDACRVVSVPHWGDSCVCPGNTCTAATVFDAGTCSFTIASDPPDFRLTSCGQAQMTFVVTDVGSSDCAFNIGVNCSGATASLPLTGASGTPGNLSPPGGSLPSSLTLTVRLDCSLVDAGPFGCYLDMYANGVDPQLPFSVTCTTCADGG
jgi:hypothetical protein